MQYVGSAAKRARDVIDKVQGLDPEVTSALQDLCQGIEGLKSDTMVYKVLVTTMQNDTNPNGPSVFAIFIQKYVWNAWVTRFTLTANNLQFTDRWDKKQ